MKLVGVISTAVLSLALGVAAPAFAQEQHDQDEKSKPAAQEEKKAQPEKATKQEAKPEERNAKQDGKNVKPAEKNEQHAGNNGGGRIPAERYQANFGRGHTFRVSQGDYRNHRFQYGGYTSDSLARGPATGCTRKMFMSSKSTACTTCATRRIPASMSS